METYTYDGVTSTPVTDLRLVVAEALMGKVADEDTEPVAYTVVVGTDGDGRPMTDEVTRRLIRQDPDVLDKYADLLVLDSEYTDGAAYVTVEQYVRVAYPASGSQLSRSSKAAELLASLGIETAPSGEGRVRRFTTNEKLTGPYAALRPSQILALLRGLGGYLHTRRTLRPDRLFRREDLAALASMPTVEAEASRARMLHQWASRVGDSPVVAADGSQVYASTRLVLGVEERATDPQAVQAYYIDQIRADLEDAGPHEPTPYSLAVHGDGAVVI